MTRPFRSDRSNPYSVVTQNIFLCNPRGAAHKQSIVGHITCHHRPTGNHRISANIYPGKNNSTRSHDGTTAYSYLPAGNDTWPNGNEIICVQMMTQRCTSINEGKRTALIHVGLDVDDTQYHGSALSKDTGEIIDFKCRPTLKDLLDQLTKLGKHFSSRSWLMPFRHQGTVLAVRREHALGARAARARSG